MKIKITQEGQPCRNCGTPVKRQEHKPGYTPKPGQNYYYEWWFACPSCKYLYMVEAAKRHTTPETLDTYIPRLAAWLAEGEKLMAQFHALQKDRT